MYWDHEQLPEGTEGNKGNIYLSTKSPPSVVKAYTEQFQKDRGVFLRTRSDELAKGGQMVLTYWGRNTEEPTCMGSDCVWDLFDTVLNQLVSEVSYCSISMLVLELHETNRITITKY